MIRRIFANRWLVRGVLAALILAVIAAVAAVWNIEGLIEQNRDRIIARVEEAIGREVSVDDLRVTIWGGLGVRLSGFSVANDPAVSQDPLVEAESLDVRVNWFPLLNRQIEITRFVLREPNIVWVSDTPVAAGAPPSGGVPEAPPEEPDASAGETESAESGPAPAEGGGDAGFTLASLSVDTIEIVDGGITVRQPDGKEWRARDVDLNLDGFAWDSAFQVSLKCAVFSERQNVAVVGKLGPIPRPFAMGGLHMDLSVSLENTAWDDLKPVMPNVLPAWMETSGPLRLEADIEASDAVFQLNNIVAETGLYGTDEPAIRFEGSVKPIRLDNLNPTLNGTLEIVRLDTGGMRETLAKADVVSGDIEFDGVATGKISLNGGLGGMNFDGSLDAGALNASVAGRFEKSAGETLTASFAGEFAGNQVKLERLKVDTPAAVVEGSGSATLGGSPAYSLDIQSNECRLQPLAAWLPALRPYEAEGTLSFDLELENRNGIALNGSAGLKGIGAKVEAMPNRIENLNGAIRFADGGAKSDNLEFQTGETRINVVLDAERLTPLRTGYTVSSPALRLADVAVVDPETHAESVLKNIEIKGTATLEDGEPSAEGTLSSAEGALGGAGFTNLRADYAYENRKARVTGLSADTMDGTLRGTMTYDMATDPPSFSADTSVERINVLSLFNTNWLSVPQTMEGRLDFNLALSGNAGDWSSIAGSLSGKGGGGIEDGVIHNMNLADSSLRGLTAVPGLTQVIAPGLAEQFSHLFQGDKTVFDRFTASLDVGGGKITLTEFSIEAPEWSCGGMGWFQFDKTVDIDANVTFSKALTGPLVERTPVLRHIVGANGLLVIPVNISGVWPNVKPKPSPRFIENFVKNSLVKQGLEKLGAGEALKELPLPLDIPGLPNPEGSQSPQSATGAADKPSLEKLLPGPFKDLLRKNGGN